jgi:hypothetical protein
VTFGDLGINELVQMRLHSLVRAFLIRSHETRIPRHIGGQDRGKTAFYRLLHGLPERADDSRNATASTEE